MARLTIPDGKLQLYVIPFYTRRNPLVSVQNVFARAYTYICMSVRVETGISSSHFSFYISTFNDKSSRLATTKTRYSQIEIDLSSLEKDIESEKYKKTNPLG